MREDISEDRYGSTRLHWVSRNIATYLPSVCLRNMGNPCRVKRDFDALGKRRLEAMRLWEGARRRPPLLAV
jgi:hypothetical protein